LRDSSEIVVIQVLVPEDLTQQIITDKALVEMVVNSVVSQALVEIVDNSVVGQASVEMVDNSVVSQALAKIVDNLTASQELVEMVVEEEAEVEDIMAPVETIVKEVIKASGDIVDKIIIRQTSEEYK
jgi:hypothetical protein